MSESPISLAVLAQLPIFAGMNEVERQQLVDIAQTICYAPGEIALAQGKLGQDLLVVLEGRCQVYRSESGGQEVVLAELGPFEVIGEMSFFRAAPHSASVRAITQLRLLRFERRDYDFLIEEDHLAAYKMAYNMLAKLADRLRQMDRRVAMLASESSDPQKASEWSHFRDRLFGDLEL